MDDHLNVSYEDKEDHTETMYMNSTTFHYSPTIFPEFRAHQANSQVEHNTFIAKQYEMIFSLDPLKSHKCDIILKE